MEPDNLLRGVLVGGVIFLVVYLLLPSRIRLRMIAVGVAGLVLAMFYMIARITMPLPLAVGFLVLVTVGAIYTARKKIS